jgi:putative ABC transport system permease protein
VTLARSSLRHLLRHPWITTLSVIGVALGVAVVVAIDLSSTSARRSFELATDAVTGQATHHIIGGPGGLDESLYTVLRADLAFRSSAPVIEARLLLPDAGRRLGLLGVDPLAEAGFRNYAGTGLSDRALLATMMQENAALMVESSARDLGLSIGDTLHVVVGGRQQTLTLAGTLEPGNELQRRGLENLLLVDISTAQELLGFEGKLSRIDLIVPEGELGSERLAELRSQLPAAVAIERSQSRTETAAELTRAFRLNIQALSLLALLCGGFLIYNSVTFSVVIRRRLFGTMRALGVTRGQILRIVLIEAVVVGLCGTLLGLFLGSFLARALIGMVAQTITDFYFSVSVTRMPVEPLVIARGLGLGLIASVLAGLRPALEATRVSPRRALMRSELERASEQNAKLAAIFGVAMIVAGTLLLLLAGKSIGVSFGAFFIFLLGCALLTPQTVLQAGRWLARPLGASLGMVGRMAGRGLAANISRTGVAVAALMLALAVSIGVGVMISGFRSTVERWLSAALPADLYFLSEDAGNDSMPSTAITDDWIVAISARPEIARVNTLRRSRVRSPHGELLLVAIDIDQRSHEAFDLKHGSQEKAWRAFYGGSGVLISEALAFRTDLELGSSLGLDTAQGRRSLEVVGIFYDYSTDRGYVLMDLERYRELWNDQGITGASAFLHDPAELDRIADQIRSEIPGDSPLIVRTDRSLREESLLVFDRTFRITGVLRSLTTIVAMIGILGALMALQFERSRELGLLRASGLTRRQLWMLVITQTGLIGLISGLLAVPVGIAMATMMTLFINQRSFGWTMPLEVDPSILLQAVAIAVAVALVAGLLPSARMAATAPAAALREE